MSLRAAFPGIGVPSLLRKSQSLKSWRANQRKQCIHRISPRTPLVVHAGSDAAGYAGPDTRSDQATVPAAPPANPPDPWTSSSSVAAAAATPSVAPATASAARSAPSDASSAAIGAHAPPPSPWDAATAVTSNESAATSGAASPGPEGSADAADGSSSSAAAPLGDHDAAAAAATGSSVRSNTDLGGSSGGSSGGPGTSAAADTATEICGSATTGNRPGSGGGGGSDDGSSSSSGTAADGAPPTAPFNLREASAELSEDTAALLSRLRAELARTSNIPIPPRRASASSSSSSSSSSSNSSNTGTAATGASSSSRTAATPAGASSSRPNVEDATASTGPAPPPPPAAATPKPVPATARPAPAAAPPPLAATPSTRGSPLPTPPASAAMSEEALAAALAAAGLPTPEGLGDSGASLWGVRLPALPPALENLLGGFLKRRRQSSPEAASLEGAAGADAPAAAAAGRTSPASTSTSPSVQSPPSPFIPTEEAAGGTPLGGSSRISSGSSSSSTATSVSSSASGSSSSSSGSTGMGGGGRKRRALVVGGGIGGLVSAARLAKEGFSVTLLEANSQVGGRCQSLQRGRFRFDTGPSLLLFIETYRRAFAALGTSLAQQVPVVRVTPAAYRVFFQGAGSLDMLYDVQRMVEQLEGVEKGAGVQYLDWLASARAALELGVEGFIARDAEGLPELMARALQDDELRSLLTSVGLPELLATHHSRMARRFRDPRLQALFTFQDLYVGLTPYNAPGVYSLLAATELTDGVWYPLGGFGQIRDALLRVGQSLGVRLRCGARVAGIRTAPGEAGGQVVTGVTLTSGEELGADVVVSNRDVPLTYELLRGPAETHGSATARRLLAQDYSAGVISFNWSVDRKLDQLLHHNVFLSGDFEGSWVRATGPDTLSRSPNFYVHCPGRTDPTACPPGSDSVMVLLPVANIQEVVKAQEAERRRGVPLGSLSGLASSVSPSALSSLSPSSSVSSSAAVDYSSLVAAGREAVLRSMAEAGITDVRQHIVDELVIDPMEWRDRYSLAHGAAFGLSHGLTQLSVFRPPLADKQVRGLYLVGASTRPGNGVPLTMISADLVVGRVVQDLAAGVI